MGNLTISTATFNSNLSVIARGKSSPFQIPWNQHFPIVFPWFPYVKSHDTTIFLWFSYGSPIFLWFSHSFQGSFPPQLAPTPVTPVPIRQNGAAGSLRAEGVLAAGEAGLVLETASRSRGPWWFWDVVMVDIYIYIYVYMIYVYVIYVYIHVYNTYIYIHTWYIWYICFFFLV